MRFALLAPIAAASLHLIVAACSATNPAQQEHLRKAWACSPHTPYHERYFGWLAENEARKAKGLAPRASHDCDGDGQPDLEATWEVEIK